MLDRFGVICLWARDMKGMVAFYRDVLRLPGSTLDPGEGYTPGVDWARFELQGAALELFPLDRSPTRAARATFPRTNAMVLCFLVGDFDAERRALESRGVVFDQVGDQEWGRFAHFLDPEGNELQIYQLNPGY